MQSNSLGVAEVVDSLQHDELRVGQRVDEGIGRPGEVLVADDHERRARHAGRVGGRERLGRRGAGTPPSRGGRCRRSRASCTKSRVWTSSGSPPCSNASASAPCTRRCGTGSRRRRSARAARNAPGVRAATRNRSCAPSEKPIASTVSVGSSGSARLDRGLEVRVLRRDRGARRPCRARAGRPESRAGPRRRAGRPNPVARQPCSNDEPSPWTRTTGWVRMPTQYSAVRDTHADVGDVSGSAFRVEATPRKR